MAPVPPDILPSRYCCLHINTDAAAGTENMRSILMSQHKATHKPHHVGESRCRISACIKKKIIIKGGGGRYKHISVNTQKNVCNRCCERPETVRQTLRQEGSFPEYSFLVYMFPMGRHHAFISGNQFKNTPN